MRTLLIATLLATFACFVTPAQAGLFGKKPEVAADEAVASRMAAVTIWVDATWGFRNQGSANSLNRAHQTFDQRGYRVHSVQPYIENGDLQGFFVTYEKR